MARSIRSTSPVMKNQFSCRPAACVKCDTHSKFPQKIPQISSAWFSFRLFRPQCTFHADCSRSVVLRAFGTVFSKSLSITTLGVGAFVVRCSFRRSLSDHDSRLARLWFGASFRRSLSDHHSRLARLWFGAVLPLSVGAFVVRSVSERPSRSRCIAARCHAAMRRPGSDRNLPCVRSWSTSLRLSVLLTCR